MRIVAIFLSINGQWNELPSPVWGDVQFQKVCEY
jgi:hypothetical protein